MQMMAEMFTLYIQNILRILPSIQVMLLPERYHTYDQNVAFKKIGPSSMHYGMLFNISTTVCFLTKATPYLYHCPISIRVGISMS